MQDQNNNPLPSLMPKFFLYIEENWPSFNSLLVTLLIEFLILAFIAPQMEFLNFFLPLPNDIIQYHVRRLVFFLFPLISTIIYWLFIRKLPKNKKNKIGILVAVRTESKAINKRVKNDLIDKLNLEIQKKGVGNIFNIIILNEFYSRKLKDKDTAHEYLNKTKSHLVIFGECITRNDNKESYIINSEILVRHAAIPLLISNQLGKEFAEIHPKQIKFEVSNEFNGFEITKELMNLSVLYIIGVAAYMSLDFELAFRLFNELYIEVQRDSNLIQAVKGFKEKVQVRLSLSAIALANAYYYSYRQTKNKELLEKVLPLLDLLQQIDPNNYSAHMLRAIYLFLKDRNIRRAKQEVKKCEAMNDVSWRYSMAFLNAYEGDMNRADNVYKKAIKGGNILPDVLFQVELFIYSILDEEPKKVQLWYCLGLINLKAKGDLITAKKSFQAFLKLSDPRNFIEQRRKAQVYISNINVEES